jgi:hypothetical protein
MFKTTVKITIVVFTNTKSVFDITANSSVDTVAFTGAVAIFEVLMFLFFRGY